MKHLFKKILILCPIIFAVSFTVNLSTPDSAFAANSCRNFLGMVSWDCNTGLTNGSSINENTLKTGIWTIAANVFTDITVIAAYLVLGFVIYGGYLYMFSRGDPTKVAFGKKTLSRAFIGLGIVLLAGIILNSLRIALRVNFSQDCVASSCVEPSSMVIGAIQWTVGIAGAVCAIFIIYGGISYISSTGDPNKVKRAKDTLLYAIIGLVIVALAEIITAFVSNTIRSAAYIQQTNKPIISKEVHEIKIN